MMGSPFYYDVLFDDGPGDVVFHDCMWSGICTCCIQLLHQDSYYQFANESPDLKVEDLNCRTQQSSTATASSTTTTSSTTTSTSTTIIAPNNNNNNSINSSITSPIGTSIGSSQFITNNNNIINDDNDPSNTQPPLSLSPLASTTLSPSATTTSALTTSALQNQIKTTSTKTSAASALVSAAAASCRHLTAGQTTITSASSHRTTIIPNINTSTLTSCRTSPDTINSSSPSSSSSSSASSPSSSSPNCSNSTSPKPIRRREHNDSERKRRDHLRNAFNFLRDQVPRFKAINKKPPRIQILHEATKYVQAIMKESEDLERRLVDEKAKHERLKLI